MGAQGYNLVFGHGFEFQDAAKRVSPDFPRTTFIVTPATATGESVAGIALAQISRGADVIFQNADAAGLGVLQAAKDRSGVYMFGSNSNQNAAAPGNGRLRSTQLRAGTFRPLE